MFASQKSWRNNFFFFSFWLLHSVSCMIFFSHFWYTWSLFYCVLYMCKRRLCYSEDCIVSYHIFAINPPNQRTVPKDWVQWTKETLNSQSDTTFKSFTAWYRLTLWANFIGSHIIINCTYKTHNIDTSFYITLKTIKS